MSEEIAFVVKGVAAAGALLLLFWHLTTTGGDMSMARGLRYVALVVAAGAVAYASQEQVAQGAHWAPRQWGGVSVILAVAAASIASILEDRGVRLPTMRRRKKR